MNTENSAQQLSDGFHLIEERARALAILIADQKALANRVALEAGLSAFDTARTMKQLTAADHACDEMITRIGLSHTAAEKLGKDIRADFPWDCPDGSLDENVVYLTVVAE